MSVYIEIAQRRLNEFMIEHKASVNEMDKVFGLRPGCTAAVLAGGSKASLYAENIVMELTEDRLAITKLNALRGIPPEAGTQEAGRHKAADETGQDQAQQIENAIASAKARLNTNIAGLCRALKKGKSYLANSKATALDGMQRPEKTAEIVASLNALTAASEEEQPPVAESSETKTGDGETIQDKAIRRVKELKIILKLPWPVISINLGYDSKTFVGNAISRHKTGDFSEEAAKTMLKAIEKVERKMGLSQASSDKKDAIVIDSAFKRKAVRALRDFKEELNGTWDDVAEALNSVGGDREFKGGALTVVIAPKSPMSDEYANDILHAVNNYDQDIHGKQILATGDSNDCDNPGDGTNHPEIKTESDEPESGTKKELASTKNEESTEKVSSDTESSTPEEMGTESDIFHENSHQLSEEHSHTEAAAYAPGLEELAAILKATVESDQRAKALARKIVEDAFGMELDELVELKPQIEMMVVCKRNGIGCSVVPESVRVS